MSLLAIASDQSKLMCLTHRYREQAHSYNWVCGGFTFSGTARNAPGTVRIANGANGG
ncbi:hypothetical protein EMIT0P265_30049 [Pseudomonas zeae]